MKKYLSALLALILCLLACISISSCAKEFSEEDWKEAFAFENVRVVCTIQPFEGEPHVGDPIYGGTHYLFDGDSAAVANAKVHLIGQDEPVLHELLSEERRELIRLFDFADRYDEFTLQEDGTYFCEESSLGDILWINDCVQNVSVSFSDGQVSKIEYKYYSARMAPPQVYTFTFSEYGQVVLEALKCPKRPASLFLTL